VAFELPPLPYDRDALAPHISADTLHLHYAQHHHGYVDKLNALVKGTPYLRLSLEDLVRRSSDEGEEEVFNNAGQAWNHTFYWSSMSPDGGGAPTGDIADAIERDFGSYEAFKEQFTRAGESQFGSGWAWLILTKGALRVIKTPNAETPLTDHKAHPLLTMDVWEHAYYLDHRNRRGDYVAAFLDHLVNWDFANANLAAA
jgi:Fe-Mn family superoxide dismutase